MYAIVDKKSIIYNNGYYIIFLKTITIFTINNWKIVLINIHFFKFELSSVRKKKIISYIL